MLDPFGPQALGSQIAWLPHALTSALACSALMCPALACWLSRVRCGTHVLDSHALGSHALGSHVPSSTGKNNKEVNINNLPPCEWVSTVMVGRNSDERSFGFTAVKAGRLPRPFLRVEWAGNISDLSY
jgi:hypothetical protein